MRKVLALAMLGVLMISSLATAAGVLAKPSTATVQMLDACDPVTFEAQGCERTGGGVTFDHAIATLLKHGTLPAWRFASGNVVVADGGTVVATNRGGEFHSFTEVDEFGGGCVDEINAVLGLSGPAAGLDCTDPGQLFGTLAAPGESVETPALSSGEHKFLCWIHPWMQATVRAD